MVRCTTETYCITLEVKVHPADIPEIERRMECTRQIYNSCLNRCMKLWKLLKCDPKWRSTLQELQEINKRSYLSDSELLRQKELRFEIRDYEKKAGLSEYGLESYALTVSRHFGCPISSSETQKTATSAWKTFNQLRFGQAKKIRFKKRSDSVTVENKTNKCGLRLRGTDILWGCSHARTLRMPLIIRKNDTYAEETFLDRTKYVSIFFRVIRGKRRVFVCITKDGTPPRKNRTVGPSHHALGIDLSPSSLVVWTRDKAILEELAPECTDIEKELRRINRAIDRSRRATNPHAFNEDGTAKRSAVYTVSNRCRKLYLKREELYRKQRVIRRQSHEKTANKLISLSGDIRVEKSSVTSWTRKTKSRRINRNNGAERTRKRLGRSVANHAPSLFISILKRKLNYVDLTLKEVDTFKVKASQYNHSTGQCAKKRLCDRWAIIDKHKVQRDLYSAFLIAHVTGEKMDTIDRDGCNADWMNFLETHETALKISNRRLGIF